MERGIILWLIYILLDALVHWYLITKRKVDINHLIATVVRAWLFILIGITIPITESTLWPWLLFTTSSFWNIFDPVLNLFRGKSLFYRGKNSLIDRFGRSAPIMYWSLKILFLIAGGITGYQLWNG